jgi:uncharacterized membrane protein YcaP (DUF421 family)
MNWLVGHSGDLGIVAAKAALMYVVALISLRLAHRRTLAQWTTIDFAAAVATGAIVGRTPLASNQSFAFGAVALVTIMVMHWVVSVARFKSGFAKLVDHRVRVLVQDGELRVAQLRLCGLTPNDVLSQLRQQGYFSLQGLRYVLYETKGGLTVVPADGRPEQELIEAGLQDAAGYDDTSGSP